MSRFFVFSQSIVCRNMCVLALVLAGFGYIFLPQQAHAISFADDLIFYAPLNNPENPLEVRVGSGQFIYKRVGSTATYVHPVTNLVTTSSSNMLPRSEDFSTDWIQSGIQVIADQSVAPDGTTTADQIIVGPSSGGNITHYAQMYVSSTIIGAVNVNQVYTSSVYVKKNSNTWVALGLVGKTGSPNTCYFNTETGAIGTCVAGVLSRTSTDVGGGWYRFSVSANIGSGGATISTRVYLAEADNDFTWTGNDTNSVYVWGAQMHSGVDLTSYIKTTADYEATPRIESGGYLSEGTRTNWILWSRDFTNAVWTKTNMNASQTVVGHDGVANSASLLGALADNATVCQGVTIASATSSASIDIKRISGSGPVFISMDGGLTYTGDLSGNLSDFSWYRAVLQNQSIVNPSLCIKLGTSGDSVALDYAQIETSGPFTSPTAAPFISSRIPTKSGTQTRWIDKLGITSTGNWSPTEGTLFVIGDVGDTANANKFFVDGGTVPTSVLLHIRSALGNGSGGILGRTTIYDGTECSYSSVNVQPQTSTKMMTQWSLTSTKKSSTASGSVPTQCTFDGYFDVNTSIIFGDAYNQDGTRTIWGHMKQVRIFNRSFSNEEMQLATSGLTGDIGTAPTAPTIGTATARNTQADVTFTPPTSDGGNTITSYTVTSSPGNITATGSASPITITGLANGTEYTFTVTATNAIGTSPASSASSRVTPAAPAATSFTLTGPTSGNINTASTNFTVTPNNVYTGTITITPSGIGSTGLSIITLTFSNSSTPQTFTITPTAIGSIVLTPSNNGGLADPSNITYTSNELTCTSWTYSDWGTCTSNQQIRMIISSSPLGCTGGSPVLTQSCSSGGGSGGGGRTWRPTPTNKTTPAQEQIARQKILSDFLTKTLKENKRTGFATRLETVLLSLTVQGTPILRDYTCQKYHTDTFGTDVPSYTCQVAEKAQAAKIISQTNTEFSPLKPVSRIEAYTLMMKSICIMPDTTPTTWQTDVIKKAMELGFTVRTLTTFDPDRPLSIPEMYTVVQRLSDYGKVYETCRDNG